MEIAPFHRELVRGGADGVVIIVPRAITAESCANCCTWSGPSTRARWFRQVWIVLIRAGPEMWLTVSQVPGTRRSPALQVEPIVGISESELHPIRVIAIALLRRSLGHSQFASAHCVITYHHRSLEADRINLASDLEGHDRDLPGDEHGDDDGRPEPTIARGPNQDLVAELLLNRQISIRAIASEHPVEQDRIPIEDLDVHISGRRIEHDRPSERLKGRVR